MHRIDHGRGMQTEVALRQRSEELCVNCGGWTTCDVSASPKAFICQMHVKEMIRPLDDGPEIHIRCGGRIR